MPHLPSFEHSVRSVGGIASRAELLRKGHSVNSIAWAVGNGPLVRVRRGWYALHDTHRDRVEATMLGGRLGSFSAAGSYGMWRGLDRNLHVSWKPNGNIAQPGRALLASGKQVVRHWRVNGLAESQDTWRESVPQTLVQIFLTANVITAMASCDSAVHLGLLDDFDLASVFSHLPRRFAPLLGEVTGQAASGLETTIRLWLVANGHRPQLQVKIGRHTVDHLVGRSLIVEADGRNFHSDEERFEADRVRTAQLHARGYTVLRFSYTMIMFDWPSVEATISAAITTGRHLDIVR